jgi:poly-gamma-glutamate synthesis protein (capsule biosynthesis protein)
MEADIVVVFMHWGIQGQQCPDGSQRALASNLVRSGADIVVGSHAHVLQGDGRLRSGYVAYGLGNYAWYTRSSSAASTTGVLTLTARPTASESGRAQVTRAEWEPAAIGADGLPTPVVGAASREFESDREALRACSGLAPA